MPLLGRQGQAAVRRHAEACTSGKTASACQAFQEGACPEADAGCGEPLAGLSQRSRCLPAISAHLESGPWKDAADCGHELVCRPDIRMRHRRTLDGVPCLPCGSGNDVNAGCKRRACRIQGMAGGKKHGEEVCLPVMLFVLPLCQETSVPGNAAGFRQGKEHPCRSLCLPLLPVMYASALSGRPGG